MTKQPPTPKKKKEKVYKEARVQPYSSDIKAYSDPYNTILPLPLCLQARQQIIPIMEDVWLLESPVGALVQLIEGHDARQKAVLPIYGRPNLGTRILF